MNNIYVDINNLDYLNNLYSEIVSNAKLAVVDNNNVGNTNPILILNSDALTIKLKSDLASADLPNYRNVTVIDNVALMLYFSSLKCPNNVIYKITYGNLNLSYYNAPVWLAMIYNTIYVTDRAKSTIADALTSIVTRSSYREAENLLNIITVNYVCSEVLLQLHDAFNVAGFSSNVSNWTTFLAALVNTGNLRAAVITKLQQVT